MTAKPHTPVSPGVDLRTTRLGLGQVTPVPLPMGQLEPGAVVVSQTASARVSVQPGQSPQWRGISDTGMSPGRSGTFATGSAAASDSAAPVTAAPLPPPYRRLPPLRRSMRATRPAVEVRDNSPEDRQPETKRSGQRRAESRRPEPKRVDVNLLDTGEWARTWLPRLLGIVAGGAVLGAVASLPVRSTAHARGVLRSSSGSQVVASNSTGAVVRLLVEAGQGVDKGQPLVRLESLQLNANAARERRELLGLQSEWAQSDQEGSEWLERREALLAERRQLLQHRLRVKQDELVNRQRRINEMNRLFEQGEASKVDLSDARAALQAATEGKLSIDTEIAQMRLEKSERAQIEKEQLSQRRLRLAAAEARSRDAEQLLELSVVRAPVAGWVEAISVVPGAVVKPGTAIARIVSEQTPTRIVAFVPVEELSFVHEGKDGRIAFESLAHPTPPELDARIVHISQEVSATTQVEAALGGAVLESSGAGAFVRVELELLDDPEYYRIQQDLRLGSPVVVSIETAERRLIDVLQSTVHEWFS